MKILNLINYFVLILVQQSSDLLLHLTSDCQIPHSILVLVISYQSCWPSSAQPLFFW